ncbi:MAG: site-specific DNA-methyltransferase, partial [Gammaproteobacteria bacterium]
KPTTTKTVESLKHDEATRKNIPTAEYQSVMQKHEQSPVRVAYERGAAGLDDAKERRNRDLDPQLVWRGKDEQDWSDLVVHAPPLYIQEKVRPKVLIDDLLKQTREQRAQEVGAQFDLFGDFNGIPEGVDKTEFYQHDQNWSNRMILGDSLQVMASLAEREGLRGKVQCIYLDPPYGIKFNSNFQWSTTSRDVKDGKADHITREPEQVKAFRDTWRDDIHSYLTYLRDRLTVARDLLTDSGSIFVQIGDENVHRVRAVMDEVFGDQNFVVEIVVKKKGSQKGELLENIADVVLFYARSKEAMKFRHQWLPREAEDDAIFSADLTGGGTFKTQIFPFEHQGIIYRPSVNNSWKTNQEGMKRIQAVGRVLIGKNQIRYERRQTDFGFTVLTNVWEDTGGASDRIYVVQTANKIIQRCLLMTTDPGDLVLDPTCGSGTTAYVAEQWGRRWITIDTSRVALALARARIMGARYPYYLLSDSRDGQIKEAEVTRTVPSSQAVRGSIRHGFVYERVPHITLKSIANNAEIDVIWDKWQQTLEPLREKHNQALVGWAERSEAHQSPGPTASDGLRSRSAHPTKTFKPFEEWEIPREADAKWPDEAKKLHADWWQARIARQKEIDASIAAKAEFEYLYDKPYDDKKKVRVAGPFTVESLSPHRVLGVDENDELIDPLKLAEDSADYTSGRSFEQMILENLETAGVQQAHKDDR